MSTASFKTSQGLELSGITPTAWGELWRTLTEDYGLCPAQLTEAASYSMAMVARFALGQSADAGKVITIVGDRPAGWVAAAAMRHLVTAGADGIVVLEEGLQPEGELSRQVFTLSRLGIPVVTLAELLADDPNRFFEHCHNVMCGLFDITRPPSENVTRFVDLINEAATPVHCVEAPLGVDPDTGKGGACPLYASSTLSLGAPLQGLRPGKDFVGRHYLCDLSIPRELYERFGVDATKAFAEQPVVQIFPLPASSVSTG